MKTAYAYRIVTWKNPADLENEINLLSRMGWQVIDLPKLVLSDQGFLWFATLRCEIQVED